MKYQPLSKEQLLQAEKEIENLKVEEARLLKAKSIGETMNRLVDTDDWKEVIEEFYLKDEVIRNAMLLPEKYFLDADQRQSLQDSIIAQAQFSDWVKATCSMGIMQGSRIQEGKERIAQLQEAIDKGLPVADTEAIPPEGA